MPIAGPVIRIPRGRLLLETGAGTGVFKDCGRLDNAAVTMGGDPTITEDFDPNACIRYEVDRAYLRPTCVLSADLVDGHAKTVAEALLSSIQDVAAAVGSVYTSPATVADGDLLNLGWAPAGTTTSGVFVPDALTSVQDSEGTPADLTLDTHYAWYEARNGVIELLDVSSFTAPLVFTGDTRATQRAVLGDALGVIRRAKLAAVDHRNQCTGEVTELWRSVIQPGAEAALSRVLEEDEQAPITINLDCLEDNTRASDSTLGRFGYWERG